MAANGEQAPQSTESAEAEEAATDTPLTSSADTKFDDSQKEATATEAEASTAPDNGASEAADESGEVVNQQRRAATEEVYFEDEEETGDSLIDALADALAMEDKMAGVVLDGIELQELIDIDLAALVLDCGSANWSVGFGGEDSPRSIFPSIMGRPRRRKRLGSSAGAAAMVTTELNDGTTTLDEVCYVGDEFEQQDDLDSFVVESPLRHGRVKNWDDMEMMLGYTYVKHAQVSPEDHPILITESPRNPRSNREKLSELLFETFQVPAMFVAIPAMLSMYSSGRVRGLGVDVGHGSMHVAAIFDGNPVMHSVQRSNMAGSLLDQCLASALSDHGAAGILRNYTGQRFVHDLKANTCYVQQRQPVRRSPATSPSSDGVRELTACAATPLEAAAAAGGEARGPVELQLPDGTAVTLDSELHQCPEALFDPSLLNLGVPEEDSPGIHQLAFSSIQKCDIDIRKEMYCNIVLSGRTTRLSGFVERFEAEIAAQAPAAAQIKVTASSDREQMVWVGGSILAQLPSFENTWVPRSTYLEEGASTMLRRCPY